MAEVIELHTRIPRPAQLAGPIVPLDAEEDQDWTKDLNRKCLRAHMRAMIDIFGSFENAKAEVLAALADTEKDGRGLCQNPE